MKYIEKHGKHMTPYDAQKYIKGVAKELGLHSQTVQAVAHEYCDKRKQHKKRHLNWRSGKKNLGWIPFNKQALRIEGDKFKIGKLSFRVWLSRPLDGLEQLGGSLTENSQGKWYLNLRVRKPVEERTPTSKSVGVDLGIKTIATTSEGEKLDRPNFTKRYAKEIAMAQRARKKKRATAIHAKIKNSRKDWNFKTAKKLCDQYDTIVVGNVSSSKLAKTKMAKSVYDASWYGLKSALGSTAIKRGVDFRIVEESYSTVTCSGCNERSGPSGLSTLGVRVWTCDSCGTVHDRDTNAAINILTNSVQGIAPKSMESQ